MMLQDSHKNDELIMSYGQTSYEVFIIDQ
uniref:Uncharacterized protein n=1 Tax=Musa acuminata subsp. malaccensis TaxID=214687 RepID=A0A804JEQ6_MUSAM